jgi:hypothetical protein
MSRWLVLAWLPVALYGQESGEVRGSVVDARGGEALASVEIRLGSGAYRATTDSTGHFRLASVAPGEYVLTVSTVGYHLIKKPFQLQAGDIKEFEVILSPDTFHQTDTVEAKADPFEAARTDSPGVLVLAGNDAKNLASVLADDPLRSVQGLPGVSSNNDFDARFSLRGADFDRVGLYLDGVLLHEPFHMIQGQSLTGSGTAFDGDMVEAMELHEGAFPARFGDRTGGVLDVTTRDGSLTGITFKAMASVSNAGVVVEGPFGKKKRGSWLVSTRKSYLQYILARTFPDTTFIFGLEDVQAHLAYDLTPKNHISLNVLESFSGLNRNTVGTNLGINSIVTAGYHYTLFNLGWRYTPVDRLLIVNHAAWMREKYDDHNPSKLPTSGGYYGEWVWNGAATWMWNARNPLEAGWSVRRLRDEGYTNQYVSVVTAPRLRDRFNGTALQEGAYLQQSFMAFSGRLRFTGGGRWDHHSVDRVAAFSPAASAALGITSSTNVQLAFGQYVQYPDLGVLDSTVVGNRSLLPLRSNHVVAGIEQRLGQRTRIHAEYYNRADRDLLFQPLYDPRVIASTGKVFAPPTNPPFMNSLRGYARGVEFYVQHSTANGLTGWVSYAFGRTGMRDSVTLAHFPSDQDQRHTINVFGSYRLRPSINLSARWSYGSAFPIPGYLRQSGTTYFLAAARNQLRLNPYSRADFRVNKSFTHDKWKLTLYGEILNLQNRTNYVFESFDGYTTSTKQAYITLDTMFPIIPSAGVVFER